MFCHLLLTNISATFNFSRDFLLRKYIVHKFLSTIHRQCEAKKIQTSVKGNGTLYKNVI